MLVTFFTTACSSNYHGLEEPVISRNPLQGHRSRRAQKNTQIGILADEFEEQCGEHASIDLAQRQAERQKTATTNNNHRRKP